MGLLGRLKRDVRVYVWDYVLAGVMVGVAMVALLTRIDIQDADRYRFHSDTWWGWAATIAICATLVGRRRWPLRSFAVALALMMSLDLAKQRDSIAFFALALALYSVAAHLRLRLAWRGVAMLVALYALLIGSGTVILPAAPLIGCVLFAAGFALGVFLRRGRLRQELEVEAATRKGIEAVETADLQAAKERLRLAQELHDVVAHSLSVIAVQAGIGAHLIARDPAEAARALDAIRTTGQTAAGELTRLVDILRDGGSAHSDAPSLCDAIMIVEQVRAAGVATMFTVEGDLDTVPTGVSLAAYRIVQEALTNVVRHAGRAHATVSILATADHVDLRVEDDGRGTTTPLEPATSDGGNGLIGMRERALMYGGEVRSGPRPGGGFRVRATLPYFSGPQANERQSSSTADVTPIEDTPSSDRRLSPWMTDVALAACMAALAAAEIMFAAPATVAPHYTATHLWAWLLRIGCCGALVPRRRYPTLTLATVWLLCLALSIGDYQVGVVVFVLWIGLYSVSVYATKPRFVGSVLGCYAGIAVIAWFKPPDLTVPGAVWVAVLFTAVASAGYVVRNDRERRAGDLVQRERAVDAVSRHAQLLITTERLRIADELSAIITSSIQTIAEEAREGSHLVELDPVAAGDALLAISAISRDALNDLRRLLKHMRTEAETNVYRPIAISNDDVGVVSAGAAI